MTTIDLAARDAVPAVTRAYDVASIQYLRGIAAMLVVFAHTNGQFLVGEHIIMRDIGLSGVDLFFVISGFIMTYTTERKRYSRRVFLINRVSRIVPIYWVATGMTAIAAGLFPFLFQNTTFTWRGLLASIAFFPSLNPDTHTAAPLLKIGWTVNCEMFFYVLFGFFLALAPARRTGVLLAIFVGLVGLQAYTKSAFAPLQQYGDPVVFEFVFGCMIGVLFTSGLLRRIPLNVSITLLALGVGLLVIGSIKDAPPDHRAWLRGIPAAMIVGASVAAEQQRAVAIKWLENLGDATYSIYCFHLFVALALSWTLKHTHLPLSDGIIWAYVVTAMILMWGFGLLAYRHVERPLNSAMKRFLLELAIPRAAHGRL